MLKLDAVVPQNVLVTRPPEAERLLASEIEGQRWGAASSPFAPEVGHHAGRRVLALQAGTNGGFDLPDVATRTFTAGIIWASPQSEAQTLLALRQGRDRNYLYLSEGADRSVTLHDNAGGLLLTLPPVGAGWQAVLFGRTGARFSLRRVGGPVVSAEAELDLPDEASLLIGCRALRQGLARSLGGACIAEVLLWRGVDVTGDDAAVADYVEWGY